jgi:hypothetical protein
VEDRVKVKQPAYDDGASLGEIGVTDVGVVFSDGGQILGIVFGTAAEDG